MAQPVIISCSGWPRFRGGMIDQLELCARAFDDRGMPPPLPMVTASVCRRKDKSRGMAMRCGMRAHATVQGLKTQQTIS
ncbi:hypothetical protein V8C44DRAFT_337655 [Trichoderma aethiopicum]